MPDRPPDEAPSHTVDKVTAFVLTCSPPRSILTFTHPTAGLQLPAGTVEPWESLLAAAAREVAEETGVQGLRGSHILDAEIIPRHDNMAIVCITTEGRPETDAAPCPTFRRGRLVRIIDRAPPHCLIAEDEWNLNVTPPVVASTAIGWVPEGALADTARRIFVAFFYDGPVAEKPWPHAADGHVFQAEWMPLDAATGFAGAQNAWLARFHPLLLALPAPSLR